MPGNMFVDPRRRNPWETMIPQILGQLFLSKVGQKMDLETWKAKSDYESAAAGAEEIRTRTRDIKRAGGMPIEEGMPAYGKGQVVRAGEQEYAIQPQEGFFRDPVDLALKQKVVPKTPVAPKYIDVGPDSELGITGGRYTYNPDGTVGKRLGAIPVKDPTTTINIGEKRFGIQKMKEAATVRTELLNNKSKKDFYEANVPIFNTTNTRNEVAYWEDKKDKWYGEGKGAETTIIKLTPTAINKGWTPQRIQERADAKGITLKQQLTEMGLLEK